MRMCAYCLGLDSSERRAYVGVGLLASLGERVAAQREEEERELRRRRGTALGAWRVAPGAGGRGAGGLGAGAGAGRRRACVPKKEPMMKGLIGLPTMGLLC